MENKEYLCEQSTLECGKLARADVTKEVNVNG